MLLASVINMPNGDGSFSGIPNLWTKSWFWGIFCEESMLVNYIYGGTVDSHKFTAICNWWELAPFAAVCPF